MSTLPGIMCKNLQTVPGDTLVADAAQRMRERRIGSLLIEKQGEYVGIVTDTDIVRKAVAEGKDLTKMTLENIMAAPLLTIESIRSVHDAHDMMADHGVRHLVVCEAGKVVGMLSARDLLVYFKGMSEPKIAQD